MDQRRSRNPDRIAAAITLFDEDVRHQRVIDRLLARHLTRHELELAFFVAKEGARVNVDALAPVLLASSGDHVALLQLSPFPDPEVIAVQHQRRIHPRLARHAPRALDAHVSRKIRRREKTFWQHAVRRRGDEPRVGAFASAGELKSGCLRIVTP
jgi:hypothetical protein